MTDPSRGRPLCCRGYKKEISPRNHFRGDLWYSFQAGFSHWCRYSRHHSMSGENPPSQTTSRLPHFGQGFGHSHGYFVSFHSQNISFARPRLAGPEGPRLRFSNLSRRYQIQQNSSCRLSFGIWCAGKDLNTNH